MSPAEFKTKWAMFSGKESAAYQEHFNDICRMLGVSTPVQADPTGNDTFCFQKRVAKDAEFFSFDDSGSVEQKPDNERGFADVWKKGCFAWEYKGKKKSLEEVYKQLLRYRESLLNPPLLVVCDFDRFIIRTNFNGTVQETHESANAHPAVNSDVVRPVESAIDLVQKNRHEWTLDFASMPFEIAVRYERPFAYVQEHVFPVRSINARQTNLKWWQYERPRVDMRKAMAGLRRFIATPGVSKHRIYVWRTQETLCNQGTLVFARDDDYFFGVLHSRFHEVWALAQGTQLREKESGFRYTPTTCFETFPLPFVTDTDEEDPLQIVAAFRAAHYHTWPDNVLREEPPLLGAEEHREAIANTAQELNDLRERWLNPPEWTQPRILEFPGSWARYVVHETVNRPTGFGLIRYSRLEPRNAGCAAKLAKRTLTNLYNERPAWLDLAHKKLDAAVAAAYGFPPGLSDDEILARLLALNLERAAEEAKSTPAKQPKTSRAKQADELI